MSLGILHGYFQDKRLHFSGRPSRGRNPSSKQQDLLSVMCGNFAIVHSHQHSPVPLEDHEGRGERERPCGAQQAIDSLRNFMHGRSTYARRDDKWEACELVGLTGDLAMLLFSLMHGDT